MNISTQKNYKKILPTAIILSALKIGRMGRVTPKLASNAQGNVTQFLDNTLRDIRGM